MEELLKEFENRMHLEGKSDKTINTYISSMREYFQWFFDSYGEVEYKKLYRENVLEYKNYLKNIKRSNRSGNNLNAKTINTKLSALIKFNELMQSDNIVINKSTAA